VGKTNRDKRRAKQKDRHGRRRTGSGDDAGSGAWSVFGQQPPRPSLEESAAGLISAAVSAGFAGDEEGIERCADQLAARAEVIGWRQAADRAMASALAGTIGGLWRGGWQPADIARWTTRERGPRHTRLAVDAIAAQLRIYPAVTVDEIFQTQLDALEARIWWNRDDDYLDAFAAQERIERPAAVRIMLQVICLVASAPALPMLCPPPGKARRGTPDPARQATSVADDKILLKVRALLAKAESTDFSEEAEAFTAGAQKLMARHSIDYALLAHQTGQHQAPVGRRIAIDNPYEGPKAALLDVIASANRCRSVWSKSLGFATVLGFADALAAVELLFTSLLVQATSALMQAGSRRDAYGRSRTRTFRQSFLSAYAHRIGERLDTATHEAEQEAAATTGGRNLLPVLADRDHAVNQATEEMFPQITLTTMTRSHDAAGWASGIAAANRAHLPSHPHAMADRANIQR